MHKKLEGEMDERGWEFFRRMMGEESHTGKINKDNWSLNIPVKLARYIGLEGGMSCKLGREGNSLTLAPLKETEMPMKIRLNSTLPKNISLIIGIPANMLVAGGLKVGDYAAWSEEDGLFRLKKAEKDAPYARKIQLIGGIGSSGITIPAEMAEKAHIKPGQYGFWTFEDDGLNQSLWMEAGGARSITKIMKAYGDYEAYFRIRIPESMRGDLGKGDEVVFEVRGDRLVIRLKQA